MKHEIEIKGNYVYMNGHTIKFDSDALAQSFIIKLVKEGIL